ncbi:MAG TPA: YhjD/YihY/BrkB family envelope integrity protein [Puia sp.]|nr:YhjD/YihY/BrkB family envelope integrity protein [Puia sp.]
MTPFFNTIKAFFSLLRDAFREFQLNDPLRMAAATSFFASFALPPIMIILTEVLGLFGNPRTIRHGLIVQLGMAMDKNIALQTREILRNLHNLTLNRGMRIAGFVFLLFVATTLFEVIKNSLNQLWKIRLKEHRGFGFLLLYRAKSIGIIVIAGLLFSMVLLGDTKGLLLPGKANGILYRVITLLASVAWFILILKSLSDGRPDWKTAVGGGIFTGLLFTIGEVVLHMVFSFNNVQTIYGASTSLVLLLLFVFYCSFIFYFGACFTQVLAIRAKRPILPTRHAVRYMLKSVEWEG